MDTLREGTMLRGKVSRYRLEKMLGQGTFGITYLASAPMKMKGPLGIIETEVRVAVKEFFMHDINGRSGTSVTSGSKGGIFDHYKSHFLREARHLSSMSHPHIVKVLELFEANNTAYFVMELLAGGSLNDVIKSKGRLSEAEAIPILRDIGSALSFMHASKMLHLDLKPQNVMLRADGSAVVIDFGLSKQYDASGKPETSTKVGMGTPGFAPLEQSVHRDGRGFPITMDVYALGATLFKMLTGNTPPEAAEVLNFPHLLPEELRRKGVSKAVASCIIKSMAPMVKDRYPTVVAFMSALPNKTKSSANRPILDDDKNGTDLDDDVVRVNMVENPKPKQKVKEEPVKVVKTQKPVEQKQEPTKDIISEMEEDSLSNPPKSRKWLYYVAAGLFLVLLIGWMANRLDASEIQVEKETFTVNGVSFHMIKERGGTFTMGATSEEGEDALDCEKPTHQVTLSDYSIGETEVTQDLWVAVMGENPSNFIGDANCPVECVSWDDCQEFIQKLNQLTGRQFRLPTEAEWEYAARGGRSNGTKYAGSNDIGTVARFEGNSGSSTSSVKTKYPNELGLYDMSGNVWEWCQDCYGDYSSSAQTNPLGLDGWYRVIRGGGLGSDAEQCRVSHRYFYSPDNSNGELGLRLALWGLDPQ